MSKINTTESVVAGAVGSTFTVGGLASIGTGATLAAIIPTAPITLPALPVLFAAIVVGYAVSEAWNWFRS